VELWIENLVLVRSMPIARRTIDVIGMVGDRIALQRVSATGGSDGAAFEFEFLRLIEVDADGRLRATIHFDPEDRDAAFAEAETRRAAGDAAGRAARP